MKFLEVFKKGNEMYYKEEVQIKNEKKLKRILDEYEVPVFIRNFFYKLASKAAMLNYWSTIKKSIAWFIKNERINKEKISDITVDDLEKLKSSDITAYFLYEKNVQNKELSTINTEKNQLSSFWEYLMNDYGVSKNVVKEVRNNELKVPKTNRQKIYKLPKEVDLLNMINKIQHKQDEFIRRRNICVLRVLRGTGLRESELAGLNVENVDFKNEIGNRAAPCIYVISKGNFCYNESGEDIVYLTKDATNALLEWFEFRKTIENIIDINAVFLNKNGKRMNEKNIQAIFKNYSEGKITPHMMRHEYITLLSKECNDIAFVQEQARHKSINTTIINYDSGIGKGDTLNVLSRL